MNRAGRQGFTLIETVVAISMFTIVLVVLGAFQRNVFSLDRVLQIALTSQREARQALKTMSAELRSASSSSTGAYPLAEVQPTSLTFYSDLDDDGLKERVRYFVDGARFRKGTLKPTGNPLTYDPAQETLVTLVNDLLTGQAMIFGYYGSTYDGTTVALPVPVVVSDVRLVKATIVIDRDPNRSPGPITLTTQVSIRNLKDNL
jgi:prepilin-type N-terminal cleavage/methylation domain-containing protein